MKVINECTYSSKKSAHIYMRESYGSMAYREEEEREGLRALGMRISRKSKLDDFLLAMKVEI